MDTEGLGLLEDIELGSLDKHTGIIRFHQPWVRPALPRSDWDTIQNMIKIYLYKFTYVVNEGATQKDVPCEYLVFLVCPLRTASGRWGRTRQCRHCTGDAEHLRRKAVPAPCATSLFSLPL